MIFKSRTSFLLNDQDWKYCFLILLAFYSISVFASDPEQNKEKPKITNIGFMENPPTELTDKFPMCDEFLKVKWIDENNRIGLTHYETYDYFGKKNEDIITAFVYLKGKNYSHTMDSYSQMGSERKPITDNLDNLIALIKEADPNKMPSPFRDDGKPGAVQISRGEHVAGVLISILADYRLNVCVPFPDNSRVYFAELQRVGRIYSEKKIDERYQKVKHIFMSARLKDNPGFPRKYFPNLQVIDVNNDGLKDYFRNMSTIYSNNDAEYSKPHLDVYKDQCGLHLIMSPGLELTSDGENFYVFETCNISKLSEQINQGDK